MMFYMQKIFQFIDFISKSWHIITFTMDLLQGRANVVHGMSWRKRA